MASDQQFCLRWNNHQSTLVSVFDNLLESQTLVDCTLAADGQYLKAHKVVLSACSPYLEAILCQNLDKHPILILKDVKFSELKAMLDYMYRGEVNISQEQLSTFLKAAESLQIKGLTDSGGGGGSETRPRQDLRKPLNQPVPHIPQPRPVVPHPGLLEPRRSLPHFPPHIADMQPQSPRHAREGSISPTARKRRRPNRPSSDDSNFVSTPNSLSENQPDTSDSCDIPTKQSAPTTPSNVPNPTKAPETDSPRSTPQPQTNSDQNKVTVKKEFSEALLTPKTELEYGNDNSMEDAVYEDEEDEEVDLSKPGTSFAANSQGFPPWQLGGDGSNDDSNNMYSPDVTATANQNNSQGVMGPEWIRTAGLEQFVVPSTFIGSGQQSQSHMMCTQQITSEVPKSEIAYGFYNSSDAYSHTEPVMKMTCVVSGCHNQLPPKNEVIPKHEVPDDSILKEIEESFRSGVFTTHETLPTDYLTTGIKCLAEKLKEKINRKIKNDSLKTNSALVHVEEKTTVKINNLSNVPFHSSNIKNNTFQFSDNLKLKPNDNASIPEEGELSKCDIPLIHQLCSNKKPAASKLYSGEKEEEYFEDDVPLINRIHSLEAKRKTRNLRYKPATKDYKESNYYFRKSVIQDFKK